MNNMNSEQLCKVCGELAAGFHFGAFTCEGCKSFFGRTYNNTSSIGECKNNNECVINKKNRTSCKSCRLKKCFEVGMAKEHSRYGRRSNWFKVSMAIEKKLEVAARAPTAMQQQQQHQQHQHQQHQQQQQHPQLPPHPHLHPHQHTHLHPHPLQHPHQHPALPPHPYLHPHQQHSHQQHSHQQQLDHLHQTNSNDNNIIDLTNCLPPTNDLSNGQTNGDGDGSNGTTNGDANNVQQQQNLIQLLSFYLYYASILNHQHQ